MLGACATTPPPPKVVATVSRPAPLMPAPPPTPMVAPAPEPPQQAPAGAPPPPPPPPPLPMDAQSLRTAYGAPDFIRKEMDSELWRYDGKNCAVFFFLYREGVLMRIRYTET